MIQYLTFMLNARKDDERGASAVEYGLLVALIAVVIIVAVVLLGHNLSTVFHGTADSIAHPDGPAPAPAG